jgi:ornithine--oxo-acid transaminase
MKQIIRIANNYNPLPVNIVRGKDVFLWDSRGRKYVDLLAGYSAVNQGHCHPKLVSTIKSQCKKITLTSRVVSNDNLYKWSGYITNLFGYDKVLAMNSGAEAVETAIKLARRVGYTYNYNNPKIICLTGNFHGRTLGTISLSDYDSYKKDFGPLLNNIIQVKMNDPLSLYNAIERNSDVCAILYEPIQGEGGINPISAEFFNALYQVKNTNKHILLMADEIQSGLGRSGGLTAGNVLYNKIKPDVLILGKALSGGMIPMSCILANNEHMDVFNPGSHGSTFGGNPLACAVSIEALKIIQNECIPNVKIQQKYISNFLHSLSGFGGGSGSVTAIRGHGMFWGIQLNERYIVNDLQLRLLEKGYITCTSRNNTLRITPPLTIKKDTLETTFQNIKETIIESINQKVLLNL